MVFVCAWMKLSTHLKKCVYAGCVSWGEEEQTSNPGRVCDWEGNCELGVREDVEVEEKKGKDNLQHNTEKLEKRQKRARKCTVTGKYCVCSVGEY